MGDQIVLHKNSKYNKKNFIGYCVLCLEKRAFRHVLFNGKNSIICTGCLAAKPVIKEDAVNTYCFKEQLTFTDKLIRLKLRLIAFFTGRYNRSRFDIRLLRGK